MMNEALAAKCQLMADNFQTVDKSAKLDLASTNALASLMFTDANVVADEAVIRKNRKLLKEKVGIFGNLRGAMNIVLLAKMSLAEDPEAYLDTVLRAYEVVCNGRFFKDDSLVNFAICLADNADPAQFEEYAEKAYEIKAKMKAAHPLLTTDEDLIIAALFAIFGVDADTAMEQAEACYEALKGSGFLFNKNSLQSISLILALTDGTVEEKCARFSGLRESLKDAGAKISGEGLPIIAALVNLSGSEEEIARDIDDAEEFLKHEKGFGVLGLGAQLRRIFATALVLQVRAQTAEQAETAKAISMAVTQDVVNTIIMTIVIIEINAILAAKAAS